MRLSLTFIIIVLFSHLLFSQKWEAAEWQEVSSLKTSGWMKLSKNGVNYSSDIRFNLDTFRTPFKVNKLIYLRSKADTLIKLRFYEGRNYQLLSLLKGKVSLYKSLGNRNEIVYFLDQGHQLTLIKKDDIEAAFRIISPYSCHPISKLSLSPHFFHDRPLMRLSKKLNNCIDDQQKLWIFNRPVHKWKYSFGFFRGTVLRYTLFTRRWSAQEKSNHIQITAERDIGMPRSPVSFEFRLSNFEAHEDNYYPSRFSRKYNRKIDIYFINVLGGLRFKILPNRNITPYLFGGVGLSYPFRFKRQLSLLSNNTPFDNWPHYHSVKTRLPLQGIYYYGYGGSFILNHRYSLNLELKVEAFDLFIDLTKKIDEDVIFDLIEQEKREFRTVFIGCSISRRF